MSNRILSLTKVGGVALIAMAATIPAVTSSESVAVADAGASIEGSYTLKGQGDDGTKYTGSAKITKIGGAMYNGVWTIGSNSFYGNCFRDDDDLSCGWALKAKDANVLAYLVTDKGLDGVWFGSGDTKLGKEFLSPSGTIKKNLSGSYAISKGENPDGSKYSGSAVLKQLTSIGEADYQFNWTIGGSPVTGVGVRNVDAGEDDVISAGFADGGSDYGALQYDISANGKTLTGQWLQSISGKMSDGIETASR